MKTLVLHPNFKRERDTARHPESKLEEAVGLALAIDLEITEALVVPIASPKPASLFGSGKVEELAALIKAEEIALAFVNAKLSPVQQRNLEKEWGCKVIDRTALILEIFGARARTYEGKLQVELAALNYQKSRLVRSWTHLERQRGGFGFLGGPGESQLEMDRRLIRDRISKLKKELEEVSRTRTLHRKTRREVPYPIVALVGYTNAGKSTLFNTLTGAGVLSMDKLFATLDPTMRALKLPSGATVILSDTVGFVSDLPHELVAAFRATLEEVLEADILLHVRDIAHEDAVPQKDDVETVLKRLFNAEILPDNVIEVLNKIDKLAPDHRPHAGHKTVAVSAITGEGIQTLLYLLDRTLAEKFYETAEIALPAANGKLLAWIHAHGHISHQHLDGETMHLTIHMTSENLARFRKQLREQTTHA